MDMDKRYCQNRQRKRKRAIPTYQVGRNELSPEEDERQFKLKRYIEDVGKYMSEKENNQDQKRLPKTTSCKPQKAVRKVIIPKLMNRNLLPHGGMQTKVVTRSGMLTREKTTQLDEDLKQIISLGNDKQCNHRCRCADNCSGRLASQTGPQNTNVLRTLHSRSPDLHRSPSPPAGLAGVEGETTLGHTSNAKPLEELDKELYPLFARVVSISCTQTKSKIFKNQSYVSAVKRKLQQIYFNGINENKKELDSGNKIKKDTRSIGTSPLSSPSKTQSSHQGIDPPFKLTLPKIPVQSSIPLLEETIGPSSSSGRHLIPSPQVSRPNHQYRQPTTSLLSPPVVGYQRPLRVSPYLSKPSKNVHEPFLPSFPSISPLYNFKPRIFHGGGEGFGFNCYNSFLPSIEEEEDSPDFRYYPRKIF